MRLSIEKSELEKVRKDLNDQRRILEEDIFQRVEKMLMGKVAEGGPKGLKAGNKVTKSYLEELPREKWFEDPPQERRSHRAAGEAGRDR